MANNVHIKKTAELTDLRDDLALQLGSNVLTSEINYGELTVEVRRSSIVNILKYLRD